MTRAVVSLRPAAATTPVPGIKEEPVNVHLAAHIRRKMAEGWPVGCTYLRMLASLSDAQLIAMKKAHDAEAKDHYELMGIARSRAAKATDTPLARVTAAAMAEHG